MGGFNRSGRPAFPPGAPLPPEEVVSTKRYRASHEQGFSDEEPPSFGSRRTPVMPAPEWPPALLTTPRPPPPAFPGGSPYAGAPRSPFPPAANPFRGVSQPPLPPAANPFHDAGDDGPELEAFPLSRVSHPELRAEAENSLSTEMPFTDLDDEEPPLPRSLMRTLVAKLLFLSIFSAVLALLAYEASMKFGIPWLDVRRLFAAVRALVH
jgi:hypothetical protein